MESKLTIMPTTLVLLLLIAGVAQATTCKPGYKDCDKNYYGNGCEINVRSDVNNCGDCGHKCSSYCGVNTVPVCKSGKCAFTCKAPFLNCDSNWKNGCEVDGSKDVNNCGACGNKCVAPAYATAKCSKGKCVYTCKAGWSNCDGDWRNGCEVDSGKDANNCGRCGTKCRAAANSVAKCSNCKCESTCKPTFADCDKNAANGCETCTGNDPNNCGACGKKCVAPAYATAKCYNGKCEYACKAGWKNCDGKWENGCETDVGKDGNNCGNCGTKCTAAPNSTPKCNNYKCENTCKPTFADCDKNPANGCETCTAVDTNNCGACGVKCVEKSNAVTKCNGGKCEYTCNLGFSNCDGDWSNGCEAACGSDINNCGSCNNKCNDVPNAVTSCNGGKCEYTCKVGYSNCDGDWSNGCEAACGSDPNNCGACGAKCDDVPNAVTSCNGGKCAYTCKPGFSNCDGDWSNGCEGDCSSDPSNCGACGVECPSYENTISTCSGGQCEYTCADGYANCDDDWSNGCECTPDSDIDNCGACGNQCPTPSYLGGEAKCTNGTCETQSCKHGWVWASKKNCCEEEGKKCFFSFCW